MNGTNIIRAEAPDRDSQYQLRGCKCGSADVIYVQVRSAAGALWEARCTSCSAKGKAFSVRHDAQIFWNHNMAAPERRLRVCPSYSV